MVRWEIVYVDREGAALEGRGGPVAIERAVVDRERPRGEDAAACGDVARKRADCDSAP